MAKTKRRRKTEKVELPLGSSPFRLKHICTFDELINFISSVQFKDVYVRLWFNYGSFRKLEHNVKQSLQNINFNLHTAIELNLEGTPSLYIADLDFTEPD